ncbi:MAG: M23 family metallopeptidase [Alphaproteobacteria bacterium]|nr:M23 family metallopeptidase [Alphaproteobacteria bacterium]
MWLVIFNLREPAGTEERTIVAPPPAPAPAPPPADESGDDLASKRLTLPVQGIGAADLVDTFAQARDGGARLHDAIDILAPRGTPVVAVEDGRILKLFESQAGGTTIYQADPTGRLHYYYAHLDAYAPGLAEGQAVRRGDLLGTVGSSGNADPAAPHLHFAIFRVEPGQKWYEGRAINPFGPLGGRARPDAARRPR